MLHYCYLFLFLLLGWRETTAAAPPNGSDELARHACTLDRNDTLQSVFLEDVISRYNLSLRQDQTNLNYPPGAYLGRILDVPCYSCLQTNPNASYHGTVMWCISIWHPTQLIESCFNRTWNYSSPLARQLGILNNIFIIDSCYVIFWRYEECLQIKRVKLYYERAILTSIRGSFHSISILNVQYPPQPPELEDFPHSPLYAPVGSDLLLDCVYSSTANLNNYISWLLSNDTELNPIAEDPTCTSDCYNDTRPLSMRSKTNRIRVYQARDQFPCIFLNYKIHTYLYIKNLQLSDRNNYTCYHRYYNSWREEKKYETLHIVPVLPVIKPVWLQVPDSTIYIDTNDTDGDVFNISLSCVVRVGLGASVQWVDPEYNIIEEYSEEWVSMYVIASNSSTPNDYEFIAQRTLVIKDYTDDISGEYKCVVTGRNLTGEYTVHLKTTSDASSSSTPSSSTASSSTSTSSSLSSSSYSVTTSSLAPPTSNPHSTSDTHQLILVLSGAFIVTFLVLFSLVAAFIIYCRYRSLSSSMKSSLSATGGTVQVLTKGIMAPPNFLFFPKFDLSEREVSRQHLMFIDRLGSGLFGQVWKAYILGSETIVAVKTTKDHCSVRDEDNLREELKIMKKIQPHANVINLLGFCTNDGPVCIIMEHALYGNLHDFLKHCRPPLFPSRRCSPSYNITMSPLSSSFSSSCSSPSSSTTPFLPSADRSSHLPLSAQLSNSTTHTYLQFSSEVTTPPPSLDQFSLDEGVRGKSVFDTFSQQVFDLLPPAHSVCPLSHDYINVPCTIRNGDFLNFAFQIASGLDHLKKMNLIHCDLAARNILVSKEQVLKISDFGLAKEVSDDKSYYRRNPRDRIPIKWTAPEALETWVYSHKSDIWSYGIVLWEIATYGESPYNEVKTSGISWDVMINYLKAGNRLEQPMDCPDIFYNIMSLCWELDPTARPDPNDIIQLLSHKSSGGHDEVETSP